MEIEPVTDEERARWPRAPMVALEAPFVDVRGGIQPLVDEAMKSAVLIESKEGSLRANHYHMTDWHYCYIVSGRMEYHYRPTGISEDPEVLIVEAGQMVFTPPMVDHAMKFTEDTTFLTLSRNPRDQASYEADVVRTELLSDDTLISWKPEE